MRTYLLLSFILLCFSVKVYAQKEGNIWYFGLEAGIDFNTTPPSPLTNGKTYSREGVAAISDSKTGQLLFYTEGTKVWDAGQGVMPNGNGLLGDYSSTQSAIIVPDPGHSQRYYIFTTAASKGMRYSVVDMNLNNGMGDVISSSKNTLLIPADKSTEKLIATRHCNGKDYWVITHTLDDDVYYVYPVTAAGIQSPLLFPIGSVIHDGGGEKVSYLKISPEGNLLANAFGNPAGSSSSKVELIHFNNQTGALTGSVIKLEGLNYPYGLEFSPDGNLLYVSTQAGQSVYQYNLRAPDINASQIILESSPNLRFGALQLAPDGKIYVSAEDGINNGYDYLSVIANPDVPGTGCNYRRDAFYLGGKKTLIGLPTFISSFFYDPAKFVVSDTCFGDQTTFRIINTQNIDSVKWDFGDHSTSYDPDAEHTYKDAGTYRVRLITYHACKSDTAYKDIRICPVYSQTKRDTLCEGTGYTLPDGSTVHSSGTFISSLKSSCGCDSIITTYLVFNPSYHISITDTVCAGQHYTLPDGTEVEKSGVYEVRLQTAKGCDSIVTFNLTVLHQPQVDLGEDFCFGPANTPVILKVNDSTAQYEWQDGSVQPEMQAYSPGVYWVKVSNRCGFAIDSVTATGACTNQLYLPTAFTPNHDGQNDVFRILNAPGKKLIAFYIFDRWGQKVFYTNDMAQGWDGTVKGKEASMGSYVYFITYTDLQNNKRTLKGSILLIR